MNLRRWFSRVAVIVALLLTVAAYAQVPTPLGLTIISNGTNVNLNWDAVPGAVSYNVYKDTKVQVDLTDPYDVSNTNSYTDNVTGTASYFYAVTAVIPTGNLAGTVLDTNAVATPAAGVWMSGNLLSDTTVAFHAKTLANGTYFVSDLTAGTYVVFTYKVLRPVMTDTVTILGGGTTTLNKQWAPFEWVHIAGHIVGDTSLSNTNVYQMTEYVWVDSLARLRIQKGTTLVGTDNPQPSLNNFSCLVIRPGGQGFLTGDKYLPIVMTSAKPAGQRRSGDWGGVTIMGNAHNNRTNGLWTTPRPVWPTGEGNVGPAGRPDTTYDGESSGVYHYVRLEWSGFRFNDTNELNGWCMYGVGRGTVMSYLESMCSKDDQIEWFGGTVNVDHFISHSTGDDGIDWTDGWNGHIQWCVISARGIESESTIEADNYEGAWDNLPRSNPSLANLTMIGAKGAPHVAAASQEGIMLRRGTLCNMHNSIQMNANWSGIDFDDSSTAWQGSHWASDDDSINNRYWLRVPNGKIVLDNMIWWNNGGAATESIDPTTGPGIGDGHFWVETGLSGGGLNHANVYRAEWDTVNCRSTEWMPINTITLCAPQGWTQELAPNFHGCGYVGQNATSHVTDPMLVNPLGLTDAEGYDPRPQAGSPCLNAAWAAPANTLPAGIQYTPYIGAFSGPNDNWMEGWTSFGSFYEN